MRMWYVYDERYLSKTYNKEVDKIAIFIPIIVPLFTISEDLLGIMTKSTKETTSLSLKLKCLCLIYEFSLL